MKKENEIKIYRVEDNKPIPGWEFHAASPKRQWMDDYIHMYRCLPMTIANQNGWVIPSPCNIKAVWFGGESRDSMHFWLDKEYNVPKPWVKCHFVGGVITFEFDFIIKTNPGVNLLVRGAPNFFIDGVHPLEGVVETDWLNYSFTMNWRVTTPNKMIYFNKGDPICFIQPIPHNYAESFNFDIDFLSNNPDLQEKFTAYNTSRYQFSGDKKAGKHNEDWQRHYFNGIDVKTGVKIGNDSHAIKLNLDNPKDQKLVSLYSTKQQVVVGNNVLMNTDITAYEYLQRSIFSELAKSEIDGVGMIALKDIKKGEQVFPRWKGETGRFSISLKEFRSLPKYTRDMIIKSYENKLDSNEVWFLLHKDGYFNLTNPFAYMNTAEENGNVDSATGIALKDIKAGEELMGTYKLENTKPRLEVIK